MALLYAYLIAATDLIFRRTTNVQRIEHLLRSCSLMRRFIAMNIDSMFIGEKMTKVVYMAVRDAYPKDDCIHLFTPGEHTDTYRAFDMVVLDEAGDLHEVARGVFYNHAHPSWHGPSQLPCQLMTKADDSLLCVFGRKHVCLQMYATLRRLPRGQKACGVG